MNSDHIIGFVSGAFDLLHPGHVRLLGTAANHCHHLVICVNCDEYCRNIKGQNRPYDPLQTRIANINKVRERLPCSSEIIVLFEETPVSVLVQVKPDVYVLGSDYRDRDIPGREYAGRVLFVERQNDVSTTQKAELMRQ